MKTFKYTARNAFGADVQGTVDANTKDEAILNLKEGGLIVAAIEPLAGEHDIDLGLGRRKTKEKALALICKQFSIILKAGLPIVRTVRLVADQTADKAVKAMLEDVSDDVAAGYGLADSFGKHADMLPATFIETVRAGEESGSLEMVFDRLSSYYEKASKSKAKVTSSMIYPCFVIGIAVVVIAIVMLFAVPTFASTFKSMGKELPWVTQFMIDSSSFWTQYFLVVAAVVVVIALAFGIALKRDPFHDRCSAASLRIPAIGRIIEMNAASQYAGTMAIMLQAGLTVVQAVAATAKVIGNFHMGRKMDSILPDLEAGKSLASTLGATAAFPALVVEMTDVGEQAGSLEETLFILSEYYDNEVDAAVARSLAIMEPAIIIVLAVIVCVILLAVYLPIFSIYGSTSSM